MTPANSMKLGAMEDSLSNRIRRRARERRRATGATGAIPTFPVPRAMTLPPPDAGNAPPPAHRRRGLHLPEGWLFALLVPQDQPNPYSLLVIPDSVTGIRDALGGVLLDACAIDGMPTHRCWVYLKSDRHDRRLPRNPHLGRLGSALGWPRNRSADWLGPALITGRDLHWADRDVPSAVLAAALPTD